MCALADPPGSAKDLWYDRNAFNQGSSTARLQSEFGDATRANPKLRSPWNLSENISLAKDYCVTERVRFWVRCQGNTPRRPQLALRLD